MSDRPCLHALANRAGILPAYFDIEGVERLTSDDTRVALLAAMGHDGSSEAAAGESLHAIDTLESQRLLEPARVVRSGSTDSTHVCLTMPPHHNGPVDCTIEFEAEDGTGCRASGRSTPTAEGRSITLTLPFLPPKGYHTLRVTLDLAAGSLSADQTLIVTPERCYPVSSRLGDGRTFGLWTNLYAVRRDKDWGVGDLTTLGEVVTTAGARGAAFVGINPLHALYNRDEHVSPYCPISRLFRNVIYIDIAAVPELAACRAARELLNSAPHKSELADVRSADRIDHAQVAKLKTDVLRLLHPAFVEHHAAGNSDRGQAYDRYVTEQGRSLIDYATFMALDEHFARAGNHDRRSWPARYQNPNSPEVATFRKDHRDTVDYHCYVQFELNRQLASAAHTARRAGMAIGLYTDLALGSAGAGSDAWASADLFAHGIEVGVPPDPYSETGQTWGFPPVDPMRLRASGYAYWIDLLRSAFAHAGMMRIDHVMGLFRQFWVPKGLPASEGAYVRYPADDLLGILSLESERHETIVVGEDLGTVPPEVRPAMAERDILSSRVMHFERACDGAFHRPDHYPLRALVTAGTHDLTPLAGLWAGRDIAIHRELGVIRTDEELDSARQDRQHTRAALSTALADAGFGIDADTCSVDTLNAAVCAFLAKTPCAIVGVSLDDLAGEIDPVNIPGVAPDQYACWTRRMRQTARIVLTQPATVQLLKQIAERLSG